MMHAHRLLICLSLATAVGCQSGNETIAPETVSSADALRAGATASNLRLKQMIATGNNGGLGPAFTDTYFTYTEGRRLQKVTVPTNTMAGKLMYEFTYDGQGRVVSSRTLNENPNYAGIIGAQSNFTFGDGVVEEKMFHVMVDGRVVASDAEPNLKITYRFNAEGQMTEQIHEGIVRFGNETSQRFTYTYENGNMVKLTALDAFGQVEFTISYAYDDKVNPFYQLRYLTDPILYCSRNNVISAKVNDNEPVRKEYTYNEQGLPLTQTYVSTGAVLSYEYETF